MFFLVRGFKFILNQVVKGGTSPSSHFIWLWPTEIMLANLTISVAAVTSTSKADPQLQSFVLSAFLNFPFFVASSGRKGRY